MKKYLKVMFGTTSGADKNLKYKIDEINIADKWNPNACDSKGMGGFNFSCEDKILRWLVRGDTLYDVEIPNGAEIVNCPSLSAPNGVFRSNKIILHNPRIITDEIAMDLYLKSDLPEKAYYKSLAGLALRGYRCTALRLIKDKINKDNIEFVLDEINDFVKPENVYNPNEEVYLEIMEYLNEIASDLLISRFIDKEPYIKVITNDKVINLTGESGSGKSYFSDKYINDENYIVIDTDIVFGNNPSDNKESLEIRKLFKDKPKDAFISDFDNCYLEILDYFKDSDKTIVIDSAQYRNIKDYSILKGKVIVMRTSIELCYERCLNRYKAVHKNYKDEEYQKYANKKLGMFSWYKSLNTFIKKIDVLKRVYLKVPSVDELHYRQEWMKDPKTMSYNAGYDIDLKGYDKKTGIIIKTNEEMLSWYNNWTNKEPDKYFAYIYDENITEPIGEVYYYLDNGIHSMGIVIQDKYRGKGYAYDALLELEKIAFEKNNISELSDIIPLDRVGAIKAFMHAGFIHTDLEQKGLVFGEIRSAIELLITKEMYLEYKKIKKV